MPGKQHVFLTFATGIIHQRKGQSVFVRAAKFVSTGAFAAFCSFTARLLDCDHIASNSVLAPNVALRIHNLERAVGFHRPDSVERIGPCAGEVAQALIKTIETPARIIRREDGIFMPSILSDGN